MNCPKCGLTMEPGRLSIDRNFLQGLIFGYGLGLGSLYFRAQGEKQVVIMGPYDRLDGYRCASCGTVILMRCVDAPS